MTRRDASIARSQHILQLPLDISVVVPTCATSRNIRPVAWSMTGFIGALIRMPLRNGDVRGSFSSVAPRESPWEPGIV
jgi:hypothetical protein